MGESGPSDFPDGNRTEKRKLNRRKPGSRPVRRAQQPCSPPRRYSSRAGGTSCAPEVQTPCREGKPAEARPRWRATKSPAPPAPAETLLAGFWMFILFFSGLPRAVPAGSRTLRAAEPPPRRPARVQRGGRAANRGQNQGRAERSAFPHPPAVPAGSGSGGPGGSGGTGAISGRRRREGGGWCSAACGWVRRGGCAGLAGCPYRLPPRGGPSLGRPDKGEVGALPCRGTCGAAQIRRGSLRLRGRSDSVAGTSVFSMDTSSHVYAC